MENHLKYQRLDPTNDNDKESHISNDISPSTDPATPVEESGILGKKTYSTNAEDQHYLSLKKEKRLKRIEVQTKAYEDLHQVIEYLRVEFGQNTQYLKSISQHFGTKPAAELIRSDGQVKVEIQVAFLRIVDINTKYGLFHAELFVQAKWKEPRLKKYSQVELDHLDFKDLWCPDIVLLNSYGEPDEVKRWFAAKAPSQEVDLPTLYARMRARGQFKETLELQDFPVDIQGLTVIVSCERPVEEVYLIPDTTSLPTVTLESFNDVNEFYLYEHVQVRNLEADVHSIDKYSRSSRIAYTCSVARKPTYFFLNFVLIQFLLAALSMLVYVDEAANFNTRTGLAATLLLTSVAFKFTITSQLPQVPYITRLEIYGKCCKIFLILQIIENGIVYYISTTSTTDVAATVDRWCGLTLGLMFVIFNIIYIIVIAKKFYENLQILDRKEKAYCLEKRKREHRMYSAATTSFGPKNNAASDV